MDFRNIFRTIRARYYLRLIVTLVTAVSMIFHSRIAPRYSRSSFVFYLASQQVVLPIALIFLTDFLGE